MDNDSFTIINNLIFDDTILKPMEKLTLMYLIRYENVEKGYSYPSLETLRKQLGYSHTRYVIKNINELIQKGCLKKETIKQRNRYYILSKVQNVHDVQIVPNVQKVPNDKVQNVHEYKVQIVPPTNTNTNTNTKKNIYMDLNFVDDVIDKVKITQAQYDKLVNKFDKDVVHRNIISLDNYIANGKGNKYKEHYRVLNTWCGKENNKSKISTKDKSYEDLIET